MVAKLFTRWVIAVALAFLLFPVAFIVWNGPDATFGHLGGIVLMLFMQFISPLQLWLIPLAVGTVAGLAWHAYAEGQAPSSSQVE